MKKIKLSRFGMSILVLLLAFSISNCSVQVKAKPSAPPPKTKKIPPGQAKKMNGDKSAKKYAPGHNK